MIIRLVLFYYYHNTIYLYKCCIHNVLSYGHLYYHFGCSLHESEGLIKNSASFISPHISHTSLAHLGIWTSKSPGYYIIHLIDFLLYISGVPYGKKSSQDKILADGSSNDNSRIKFSLMSVTEESRDRTRQSSEVHWKYVLDDDGSKRTDLRSFTPK